MTLSLEVSDRELTWIIDSLMETLIQVDGSEQEAVADLINRVRVAAGLPEQALIDRSADW